MILKSKFFSITLGFLLFLCSAYAYMNHGGQTNLPSEGIGSFSDAIYQGEIAKEAQLRGREGYCSPSASPPDNLKCAHQASDIVSKYLGDSVKTDGVLDLVEEVKGRGWQECSGPVEGAIAASNPSIPGTSSRSHTGVVAMGDDGLGYCISHNSGAEGGCLVRTGLNGYSNCEKGDAGSQPFNDAWSKDVKFYAPDCNFKSPENRVASFNAKENFLFKTYLGHILSAFSVPQLFAAKPSKKVEEKTRLIKEFNFPTYRMKLEAVELKASKGAEEKWYVLSAFEPKQKHWIHLASDQSLWAYFDRDSRSILTKANEKIVKSLSPEQSDAIFKAQVEDSYSGSNLKILKKQLDAEEVSGKITPERKWINKNFLGSAK